MTSDSAPLFDALEELAGLTVHEERAEATAEAVVALAMQTVECGHDGLTVFTKGGGFASMAPSDALVARADNLQHELGEGPCVDAAVEVSTFVSSDLGADPRWPRGGPAVAELGLHSLLATRMVSGGQALGALNLYSGQRRQFSAEHRDDAQVFAVHAAAAIMAVREREHLRTAMDARTLIGQAQGILMERFDIDADRAFAVLRRYSQTHNVKLRVLAEDVVTNRRLPGDEAAVAPLTPA